MDETLLQNLATQFAAIRIQMGLIRSFLADCGIPVESFDAAVQQEIDGPAFQLARDHVLKELLKNVVATIH